MTSLKKLTYSCHLGWEESWVAIETVARLCKQIMLKETEGRGMYKGPEAGKRNTNDACMIGQWWLIANSEANLGKSQGQDHEGLPGEGT